jgi:hypothetical protein
MNTEDLLKPRYKVIADYPMSEFKVGKVYEFNSHSAHIVFGNYHAILRDEKDMPAYVNWNDKVFKVATLFEGKHTGWQNYSVYILDESGNETNIYGDSVRALFYNKEKILPATGKEYLDFINQQK